MINQKAAQERKALLKRLCELYEEIAELQKEAEAKLPIEEQFRCNLERYITAQLPHAAGKVNVEIVRPGPNTAAVFSATRKKWPQGPKSQNFFFALAADRSFKRE